MACFLILISFCFSLLCWSGHIFGGQVPAFPAGTRDFDPEVAIDAVSAGSAGDLVGRFPCLVAAKVNTVASGGSAIASAFSVKHVSGITTDAPEDGVAYLRTNGTTGTMFKQEAGVTAATVRVFVLVRSVNGDPSYTNDKAYSLGDVDIAATRKG